MTDRLAGQGLGPRGGSVALLASAADATTAPAIVGDLAPAILPRRAWGAPAADGWPVERAPVRAVVVHHTGTANDEPDSLAMLRRVARLHAHERGWGDIGYSFIVLNDGRIAEGRTGSATAPAPDGVVAGHAYGHNVGTVGIALAGRLGVARTASGRRRRHLRPPHERRAGASGQRRSAPGSDLHAPRRRRHHLSRRWCGQALPDLRHAVAALLR